MGDILFLAHRVPFPPNRGDKIRAHNLLKRLAGLAPVHVACFSETAEEREASVEVERVSKSACVVQRRKPLVLAGAEAVLSGQPVSLTAFHSRSIADYVTACLAQYPIDTIVVFSGQMGQYVPDNFAGTVIIDLCDVDSAKFQEYAEQGERVWLNAREASLLAREEERLGRRADATILISENEAQLYHSRLESPRGVNVVVMGNGIDADHFDPQTAQPHPELSGGSGPHLVFTGQMDYRPNEQAALWMIEQGMPAVLNRFPDAKFHVVGRNPTPALRARHGSNGTQVWGEVPDVRPFLRSADAVVAPLQIARGVQNKVLEAMAMARPVILTEQAATGIAARNGVEWCVVPLSGQSLAETVTELMSDTDMASEIGAAARRFVVGKHEWNAVLAPLSGMVTAGRAVRNAA